MNKVDEKPDFSLRKTLIIEDYKTYFESSINNRNRVDTLRQWEITLLVALFSYGLTQKVLPTLISLIVLVLIIFAFFEMVVRGRTRLGNELACEIEKLLSSGDDAHILNNYSFRVTRWLNIPFSRQLKAALFSFFFPDFIVWNLSLITLTLILTLI